jgi:hypothetical protein
VSDDAKKKLDEELAAGAIEMTIRRVVCVVHGEPLRAKWPMGYAMMVLKLFELVIGSKSTDASQDKVWKDARRALKLGADAEVPSKEGMEAAFDHKPLCCRVPPGTLERLYESSGIGERARCVVCRRKRLGTPIKTTEAELPHVCFSCVIHRATRTDN